MKSFSLEGHIKELEAIERYFQTPDMDIELAIKKHHVALKLAKEVEDYLAEAETKITQITMNEIARPNQDSEMSE